MLNKCLVLIVSLAMISHEVVAKSDKHGPKNTVCKTKGKLQGTFPEQTSNYDFGKEGNVEWISVKSSKENNNSHSSYQSWEGAKIPIVLKPSGAGPKATAIIQLAMKAGDTAFEFPMEGVPKFKAPQGLKNQDSYQGLFNCQIMRSRSDGYCLIGSEQPRCCYTSYDPKLLTQYPLPTSCSNSHPMDKSTSNGERNDLNATTEDASVGIPMPSRSCTMLDSGSNKSYTFGCLGLCFKALIVQLEFLPSPSVNELGKVNLAYIGKRTLIAQDKGPQEVANTDLKNITTSAYFKTTGNEETVYKQISLGEFPISMNKSNEIWMSWVEVDSTYKGDDRIGPILQVGEGGSDKIIVSFDFGRQSIDQLIMDQYGWSGEEIQLPAIPFVFRPFYFGIQAIKGGPVVEYEILCKYEEPETELDMAPIIAIGVVAGILMVLFFCVVLFHLWRERHNRDRRREEARRISNAVKPNTTIPDELQEEKAIFND